jgi:hypothetical protein
MKLTILLVCTVLFFRPGTVQSQPVQPTKSQCAILEQALEAYRAIKLGITRKDVERDFKYDGGASFRDHGRYTYRGCDYIKLEVTFEPSPNQPDVLSSPDDTVTAASKLFIDYPAR